jgi:hypothetical protein
MRVPMRVPSLAAAVTLMASLAAAGCLEKTPSGSQGYLPDSGGIFAQGNCPEAGASSADAGASAEAAANNDASADDASADDANADDASADDASADATTDANGGSGAQAWAGTWTFVSGGSGVACPDAISAAASMGTLTIQAASGGGALTVSEDACTFHFTLAGDTATSDCGQACSAWEIPTIPIWTLTLKPDGTLEEHLGGRIGLNGETCTISGTSKLTRSTP